MQELCTALALYVRTDKVSLSLICLPPPVLCRFVPARLASLALLCVLEALPYQECHGASLPPDERGGCNNVSLCVPFSLSLKVEMYDDPFSQAAVFRPEWEHEFAQVQCHSVRFQSWLTLVAVSFSALSLSVVSARTARPNCACGRM